ncbi:MAG: preprotein translocase subunit SecG [Robiginitomaculum sp.]|nr:MAG: preprotein translocase subunit SecG [Robiginitomaculum sp.]
MANVLLIILLIISIILIGLILIQRSEGGALGIGGGSGGGGGGGLMSGRGTADLVQKMTAVFGAAFLLVTLLISIAFNIEQANKGLLDAENAESGLVQPANTVDKNENAPLNKEASSGNTTTPLEADSKTEESEAEVQEKPKKDEG